MHVDACGKTRLFSTHAEFHAMSVFQLLFACRRPSLATAGVSFSILCRRIDKRHPAQLPVDTSQPSRYRGHTSHTNNGTSKFGLSHVDLHGFCSKGFCFTAQVAIGFKCYSFIAEHPCLIDLRRVTPKSTTWRLQFLADMWQWCSVHRYFAVWHFQSKKNI